MGQFDKYGQTPLIVAAHEKHLELNYISKYGILVNYEWNPIFCNLV